MNTDKLTIQHDLARRGISQADLARHLGVKPAIVSKVVSGRERSLRVETEIVRIIGWCPFDQAVTRKGKATDGTDPQ